MQSEIEFPLSFSAKNAFKPPFTSVQRYLR